MIRTLEDFQTGLLVIPNASLAANASDRTVYIQEFIEVHEKEILIKGLGVSLYNRLKDAISDDDSTDIAISNLLNGVTYTYNGREVMWEGLKDKYSFLSYYIFTKYVRKQREEFTNLGTQRPDAANSESVSPLKLITDTYRMFHEKYQGTDRTPYVGRSVFGHYVDYYGTDNLQRSLYQFLLDNKEDYPDSGFRFIDNINTFGL